MHLCTSDFWKKGNGKIFFGYVKKNVSNHWLAALQLLTIRNDKQLGWKQLLKKMFKAHYTIK